MDMVIVPILLLHLLLLVPLASAQWQSCGDSGTYTSNSTYQTNLRLLSSILPKKVVSNTTLFSTGTVGHAPDIVYALALCRGDTTDAPHCESCVATAFDDAQQLCPYSKDATLYYHAGSSCMLRFSDQNFLSTTVNEKILVLWDALNISTSAAQSRLFLFTLLNATAHSAARNPRRFTTSRLDVGPSRTLYCLMQCTPDLTADDCAACFQPYTQYTLQNGKQGGVVVGTRCSMSYEIFPYFQGDPMLRIGQLASSVPAINNTPGSTSFTMVYRESHAPAAGLPPDAQTTVPKHHGRNSGKRGWWIISVVAPLLSILLCLICSLVWMRRRRKVPNRLDQCEDQVALVLMLEGKSSEFTLFDFSKIRQATHNFSKENLLGQGGFGPVYKGQLQDGTKIAVKRLARNSGQGFTEFKNEVELLAKLQHNNLVKLLGCCIQGEERLLVYEYLPNKSLDFFIFDENRTTLVDWNKRREIIEGIAQGLLYLHKHSRLRIIHRDLKSSNILLDQDMNPKISDFGLGKIFSSNDTQGNTNRVVGTYGYMSPEYAYKGIYSIKSDVFSFGVLLLEILSGKKNSGFRHSEDFINLLEYSWQLWECGRWLEILEASILTEIHAAEARRYINIALMCVQDNADDRPTTSNVVAMINNESVILPYPNHPAYFNLRIPKIHESATVVVPCSNNDVTITEEPNGR